MAYGESMDSKNDSSSEDDAQKTTAPKVGYQAYFSWSSRSSVGRTSIQELLVQVDPWQIEAEWQENLEISNSDG